MAQGDNGITISKYKSNGIQYQLEIMIVPTNGVAVTLVSDFEFVEETLYSEIDNWDQPLQKPQYRVLALCHVETDEVRYVEVFTYEVTISIVDSDKETNVNFNEVEVMDFDTFLACMELNESK